MEDDRPGFEEAARRGTEALRKEVLALDRRYHEQQELVIEMQHSLQSLEQQLGNA